MQKFQNKKLLNIQKITVNLINNLKKPPKINPKQYNYNNTYNKIKFNINMKIQM